MRPDDDAAALDGVGIEGDGPVAATGPDPSADFDEDLLEAELGEFDELLADEELDGFEEQVLDADGDEDEDEDDFELALLQELGVDDLDAPDAESFGFDLRVGFEDDPADDEVAA